MPVQSQEPPFPAPHAGYYGHSRLPVADGRAPPDGSLHRCHPRRGAGIGRSLRRARDLAASRTQSAPASARTLALAGYVAATTDYRLAPGATWPDPLTDVSAALAALRARYLGPPAVGVPRPPPRPRWGRLS